MTIEKLFIDENLPEPLTKEQVYKLYGKIYQGDSSAKEEIIYHNIKLVIDCVVKKYSNSGYDKKELVSVGLIGLIKGVNSFDTSKNVEFATYVSICIRNEILMFFRKNNKHFNSGSFEQLVCSESGNSDIKLIDVLDDKSSDFISEIENKVLAIKVRQIIDELPPREREMVLLNFGFIDNRIYTQAEIAKKFGIAASYVSRIIQKSLKVMKRKLESNDFNSPVNNDIISKSDYQELCNVCRSVDFQKTLEVLSLEEAIIVYLKLGFINDKHFSNRVVANLLGMKEDKVFELTNKTFLEHKEYIDSIKPIDKKKTLKRN